MKQVKVLAVSSQFIRNICLIFYLIAHINQLSPFEPVTFRVDSSSLSASVDFARKKIIFLGAAPFRVHFLDLLSTFQGKPAWPSLPKSRTA